MLSRKEKLLTKKVKATKHVQQLRKRVLSARKKTVRLQQLRWLRGAASGQLPLALGTRSALRQLYISATPKFSVERKVSLRLSQHRMQQILRFSKVTGLLGIRSKWKAAIANLPKLSESALFNAPSNLAVFAQKRRRFLLSSKLHATPAAVSSILPVKKATKRRRYLRRQKYQLNRVIHSLLLRRAARKLSSRVARAERISPERGQLMYQARTLVTNGSTLLLATAKHAFKRVAPTAQKMVTSKRHTVGWTAVKYQQCIRFAARLAKKLKMVKAQNTQKRTASTRARETKLTRTYKQAKEALRFRFFGRKAFAVHLSKSAAPATAESNLYHRSTQRQVLSAVVTPLPPGLATASSQLRLKRMVKSAVRAATLSPRPAFVGPALKRLPRRAKRVLAAARRESKKFGKLGQKRRRTGVRSQKPGKRALVTIARVQRAGRKVNGRRAAPQYQRGRLLAGLAWIKASRRKLASGKSALGRSTLAHAVSEKQSRQLLRTTLWAMLRATKRIKSNSSEAPAQEHEALDALSMRLRRGLRRGVYSGDKVLSTLLFLVRMLSFDNLEQKKLYLILRRWQTVHTYPAVARQYSRTKVRLKVAKPVATDSYTARHKLLARLSVKAPRPLAFPQPAPALVIAATGFEHPPIKFIPYAVSPVVPTESTDCVLQGVAETYTPLRDPALTSATSYQKKRLLPKVARKQSRFPRFIPSRVKSRLLREITATHNKAAAPTARFPVVRYFHQFYTKGNRVFASRYKKGLRVTAKRLVKQSRWSRATLLRLSRRRPAWRRTPRGRQCLSATSRVATLAPYIGVNSGWRARRNRIKQRRLFRAQAEHFKVLARHVGSSYPPADNVRSAGLPPRVLQLTTPTEKQLRSVPVPVSAAAGFHVAQRQLAVQRTSRAAHAKRAFSRSTRRFSNGLYKRYRGRFLPITSKKRRRRRKPRWVRLLSKTAPQTSNTTLSPKYTIFSAHKSTESLNSTSPLLRTQLWTALGSRCRVRNPMGAAAKVTVVSLDRSLLIKKLHRLALFKSLLLGNKFNKLTRLGELNALGDHRYLGGLNRLVELGSFTEELKLQLLLRLATDIKRCAALCAASPAVQPQLAVTARVSSRVVFTHSKPSATPSRDTAFFQSSATRKSLAPSLRARKLALLKVLTQQGNKKVASGPLGNRPVPALLSRAAWTNRAAVVTISRRYRRSLRAKVHFRLSQNEHQRLLVRRAPHANLRALKRGGMFQSSRKQTAYLLPADRLPAAYKKTMGATTVPQFWITRLGRWVKSTAPRSHLSHARGQTLPKTFSTTRPWGVKVVQAGSIAKDYGRLLAGVHRELVVSKKRSGVHTSKAKATPSATLLPLRLAAARAICAQRFGVLHLTPATSSNKFWRPRLQSRDQTRVQAEQRLKAPVRMRRRVSVRTVMAPRQRTATQYKRAVKIKRAVKTLVPTPATKVEFTRYYIKDLKLCVFDTTVRSNLQRYYGLSAEEKAGEQGYEFIRRAYKSALSSQERNPKLPQPEFEQQRALLVPLLTQLGGVAPSGSVLGWKQLPKNKVLLQHVVSVVPQKHSSSVVAAPSELTAAEIASIRDEATKKNLKKFIMTTAAARLDNTAYLLVKKAVLHSWTLVEGSATPKESPYYNDLFLAAKAYSFYGVTLDITSRAATKSKLAPSFAKLPK